VKIEVGADVIDRTTRCQRQQFSSLSGAVESFCEVKYVVRVVFIASSVPSGAAVQSQESRVSSQFTVPSFHASYRGAPFLSG
jgi:hypothetical protein